MSVVRPESSIVRKQNRIEINSRTTAGQSSDTWRLNHTLLHNMWVKEGIS